MKDTDLHQLTGSEIEEASKVLETLALEFAKESKEYKVIELAAKALLFAFQHRTAAQFVSFLRQFDSELTDEQKKRLSDLGIQP